MRPGIYAPRTRGDGTIHPMAPAEIVAVFSAAERRADGALAAEADYVLLQYYKPALPGTAMDVLCPPEDVDSVEPQPTRHPLIPACDYVILSDYFELHSPNDVVCRAVFVHAIPSERSPPLAAEARMASRENAYQERSPFFVLRPLL